MIIKKRHDPEKNIYDGKWPLTKVRHGDDVKLPKTSPLSVSMAIIVNAGARTYRFIVSRQAPSRTRAKKDNDKYISNDARAKT